MLYRSRELNNLTSVVIVYDGYTIYTNWGLITNVSRIIYLQKLISILHPNLHSISPRQAFSCEWNFDINLRGGSRYSVFVLFDEWFYRINRTNLRRDWEKEMEQELIVWNNKVDEYYRTWNSSTWFRPPFIYIFRKRKISPASGIDLYCNCTYVYEVIIRNIKYEHATRRRNTHCHTDFNF